MRQSGTISSWLLPPMWPGFESQRILYTQSYTQSWVCWGFSSLLGREVFLTGIPIFPSPPKALPHEGIQDSLGFWISRCGFRILLDSVFVGRTWILDSNPIFVSGILDSLSVFRIPKVKFFQIPESGFLYTGRKSNISNSNSIWKVSQVCWRPGLWNLHGFNGSINNVSLVRDHAQWPKFRSDIIWFAG